MATRANRLLRPFRDYDPHDVINIFALNGTGLAGQLVKVQTFLPSSGYFWSTDNVGAQFGGITSTRWENPARVVKAGSGDSRFNGTLGFTLANVQEYDENGQKLILGHRRKADENNAVLSGETVPIITRGLFSVAASLYSGSLNPPTPGYMVTISYAGGLNAGYLDSVPFSTIISTSGSLGTTQNGVSGVYTNDQVIGTWISSSGVEQSGYAFMLLRN